VTATLRAGSGKPIADLVPLADRVRWALGFRLGVVVAPIVLWLAVPGARTAGLSRLLYPALAYSALAVLASPRASWGRAVTVWMFMTNLLADGAYLGWALHCLHGLSGPIGYVVMVHVVAVTLLASFRTGLKLAMWHSIVALAVINAEIAKVIPGGAPTGRDFPTSAYAVYMAAIWAAALVTSTFAAVNERELRRRRYDGEVLRKFGLELETATDPVRILLLLGRLAQEELLAPRAIVMTLADDGSGADAGTVVQVREGAKPQVGRLPVGTPPGALFDKALARRGPVLAAGLQAAYDPWLAALWPEARDIVAVPFSLEGQMSGALIFESARRGVLGAGTIERRAVSTAEQATGHAAMALGRATLLGRLRAAADTDGLTGAANRRTFDVALAEAVRGSAASGRGFGIALIDLDNFKRLNDTHGHLVGDDVLRSAAAAIRSTCREQDIAARYGGEEFVVILTDLELGEAAVAAERIRAAIEACDSPVPVTASIGVAAFPAAGADGRSVVAAADEALYAAKSGGRNRVVAAGDPGSIVAPGDPGSIVAPGDPGSIVAAGDPGSIVAPGDPAAAVEPHA
jgi:two-component system cell cycle response regulator